MSTPLALATDRPQVWATRPGWGISADLLPPEVVERRRVAGLRRRLGGGLLALLVLIGGCVVLAGFHHRSQDAALAREQTVQSQLLARANRYRDVTSTQAVLLRLQRQVDTLMAGDVDVDTLGRRLSSSRPPGLKITSEAVTISGAGTSAAAGTTASAANGIGTIALTGTARHLDDVATYVQRLQAVPGLADVVPTSTTAAKGKVSFTATINMTTRLLSHRFAAPAAAR